MLYNKYHDLFVVKSAEPVANTQNTGLTPFIIKECKKYNEGKVVRYIKKSNLTFSAVGFIASLLVEIYLILRGTYCYYNR